MVSASLIASAVAARLTSQKLRPPMTPAASVQPATKSRTSRLTEMGRAVADRVAPRLRKGSATLGSLAATEPSTAPVWPFPDFPPVAARQQPGDPCYDFGLPADDMPSSVRRRQQARNRPR